MNSRRTELVFKKYIAFSAIARLFSRKCTETCSLCKFHRLEKLSVPAVLSCCISFVGFCSLDSKQINPQTGGEGGMWQLLYNLMGRGANCKALLDNIIWSMESSKTDLFVLCNM